jgi:hypothetical protein
VRDGCNSTAVSILAGERLHNHRFAFEHTVDLYAAADIERMGCRECFLREIGRPTRGFTGAVSVFWGTPSIGPS